MIRRIKSKRINGKHKPFCRMDLRYFINQLIENPNKIPTNCEIETLKEYGYSLELFKKEHEKFVVALNKVSNRDVSGYEIQKDDDGKIFVHLIRRVKSAVKENQVQKKRIRKNN